jgi:circadian clock protein KaiC
MVLEIELSRTTQQTVPDLVSTGIPGLDEVLGGGLPRHHPYLVYGDAGTGKTTMGLHFLMEGVRAGESALLVTLGETTADLRVIAASHGWSLEGVRIFELAPATAAQQLEEQQTIFPTAEVELNEMTDEIIEVLREMRPERVVFDSVTEIRLMADAPYRYRRQILALSNVLEEIQATVLFTQREVRSWGDRVLDSLVHGIIYLERRVPEYGTAQRRLDVSKLRGMNYPGGWHDYRILPGGISVFPRIQLAESHQEHASWNRLSGGLPELDRLLGGGLEMGTSSLIVGASGTGKSSIAGLYLYSALQKGIPSAMFIFDERPETLYKRSDDLGIPLRPFVEKGQLLVRQVETGEISAGEFAYHIRELVEIQGVRLLVIDSLTGYQRAVQEEKELMNQMHDLVNYLSHHGVLSILIVTNHGLLAQGMEQDLDMSYLADTVLLMRHFEANGTLRQAISVVKKRHGEHEKAIREVQVRPGGVQIGEPLTRFHGVLTGNPVYEGSVDFLLDTGEPDTDRS